MTHPKELMAWLGPAADEMTPEQIHLAGDIAIKIDAYYPDPDEQPERDAALSAVVQHLLGETTPDQAQRDLSSAIRREQEARAAATWLGVALVGAGAPKAAAARAVGIDRMSLLEALGERSRRRKSS